MKPSLASPFISFGRVKASARKMTSGWRSCTSMDQPFPERERLGVGIVDAENADALVDPEQHHVAQRIPQRAGVFAGEIGIDDVLIFLRRIFRVTHRAVRPALEPLRMLLEPGMVGRTLHGEIERHFHIERLAGRDEFAEILQRAQLRMHRVVAAFGRTDRIGAAGIAIERGHRIVAALAIGLSDRVDRREIDDVKTHRPDIGKPRDAILEGAMLARRLALAARHHLVPGAGPRPRPVRDERKQLRPRQIGPQLALRHRVLQFVGEQRRGFAGLQEILALAQDHGGGGRTAGLRLGQHARALDGIEGEVGAGLLLQFKAMPPGGEFVGPGLDGIDIASGLVRHERAAPAVVAVMDHRRAAPFAVLLATPDQCAGNHVMAVAIDIRPDLDALARRCASQESGRRRSAGKHLRYGKHRRQRSRQFELFCSR